MSKRLEEEYLRTGREAVERKYWTEEEMATKMNKIHNMDCLEFMKQVPDNYFDLVLTDPPYGMSFKSNHRTESHIKIANDDNSEVFVWSCGIPVNHSRYVFCRWDNIGEAPTLPKSCITWVKNNWSMGDLKHEHGRQTEVLLFWNGENHEWPGKRPSDVIYSQRTGNEEHPTQKPIYLMEQIVNWTAGTVVDPFMGSGSTGVACMNLKRKFIGIEIERKYFDIACERIENSQRQTSLFF